MLFSQCSLIVWIFKHLWSIMYIYAENSQCLRLKQIDHKYVFLCPFLHFTLFVAHYHKMLTTSYTSSIFISYSYYYVRSLQFKPVYTKIICKDLRLKSFDELIINHCSNCVKYANAFKKVLQVWIIVFWHLLWMFVHLNEDYNS